LACRLGIAALYLGLVHRPDRGVGQQDLDLEPDQTAKRVKSARNEVLVYDLPQPVPHHAPALLLVVEHSGPMTSITPWLVPISSMMVLLAKRPSCSMATRKTITGAHWTCRACPRRSPVWGKRRLSRLGAGAHDAIVASELARDSDKWLGRIGGDNDGRVGCGCDKFRHNVLIRYLFASRRRRWPVRAGTVRQCDCRVTSARAQGSLARDCPPDTGRSRPWRRGQLAARLSYFHRENRRRCRHRSYTG
jgi:hypothetical protein